MNNLYLAGAFTDIDNARQVAIQVGGHLFCDERESTEHLPYAALVTGVTDDLSGFSNAADVGTYLVCERVMKPRQITQTTNNKLPGVISLSTMIARSDLTHLDADNHWRDNHVPLALEIHKAMTNYRQFSILHCFNGPLWDGFALCGFDTEEDLRERFFDTPAGKQAIFEDIAKFADPKSPRRLIVKEYVYAA